MDRWRILDIEQNGRSESENPRSETRKRWAETRSSGRARNHGGASIRATNANSQPMPMVTARHGRRRTRNNTQERSYSLRSGEVGGLSDIGKFRTVDTKDLARFAYEDDEARMNQDIRSLRSRRLIEEKTIYRAHREPRRILTLTEQGQRILRKGRHVRTIKRYTTAS